MFDYRRTHDCGALTAKDIASQVTLSGWVHRRRDHGGLIFIDLRDRYGLTQLVFDPKINADAHTEANKLRSEWVISVIGNVIPRAEGMTNQNLSTGEIEIEVQEIQILSKALTPPFSICDDNIEVKEDIRLKYRYLDMRRGDIAQKMIMRHKVMLLTRNYFNDKGFLEINTPILSNSTPEGARDYLVPSRIYPGSFYALPQSPQIFKQLLMISGMDRYFQIAPCFRDEDLRASRQPEFTQIDLEMSFSTRETLFPLIENLCKDIFKECIEVDIPTPFRQITYEECIEKYGTDKPDLRFGMEFHALNDIAEKSTFSVLLDQVKDGNVVKGFCVPGGADISRRIIDEYTNFVGQFGIKGLAWMKRQEDGLTSSIVKFFSKELQEQLIDRMNIEVGDLIFIIADNKNSTNQALDHLRRKIARDRNMIDENKYEFLWVIDFPLFSWNAEEQRMESEHHPFTGVAEKDFDKLDTEPLNVCSSSYDLVLNGYELASGSQRIHDGDLQQKIFNILQLSPEDIEERFGFFVKSLKYGTPPHLGIGIGLERLLMILTNTENIRDVIAFPKTQKGSDLMTESPSNVTKEQLHDLKINFSNYKS
jgi:aspartyl-tRNA synthetase